MQSCFLSNRGVASSVGGRSGVLAYRSPRLNERRKVFASASPAPTAVRIPQILETLCEGKDLTREDTEACLEYLLEDGDEVQIAALLVLLRAKGETPEEIAGLATTMKKKATRVNTPHDVVDIVGTGGDSIGSINISTGSSVVAAAAGAKVAKHGNRSVSSLCGSADVLEELGVAIDLGPESISRCLDSAGVAFMFAPRYHPAMKAIVPVRRKLKVRTAFNILGPMLNPADAPYGLIGVYSTDLMPLMANSLVQLGTKKALVVHSMGLDELTPIGPADVMEVTPEGTKSYRLDAKDVGIPPCEVEDLKGGDRVLNAKILRDVFGGAKGPIADALCLNAGYALASCGVAENPIEGVAMAQEAQQSGKAGDVLSNWIDISQKEKAGELATA
ncbi:hypothetical protein BSKO_06236 [Bryopsis sp. KO-2023]|nr:hypothetical protein BSKO_06236 [Bryopsis sp. KO-2023]